MLITGALSACWLTGARRSQAIISTILAVASLRRLSHCWLMRCAIGGRRGELCILREFRMAMVPTDAFATVSRIRPYPGHCEVGRGSAFAPDYFAEFDNNSRGWRDA